MEKRRGEKKAECFFFCGSRLIVVLYIYIQNTFLRVAVGGRVYNYNVNRTGSVRVYLNKFMREFR